MSDLGILIPIVALSIPIVAIWTKHRRDVIAMELQATAEKAAQYAAQTERLEARVRVLERIATDRGVDVADEIEKLRDAPLN